MTKPAHNAFKANVKSCRMNEIDVVGTYRIDDPGSPEPGDYDQSNPDSPAYLSDSC